MNQEKITNIKYHIFNQALDRILDKMQEVKY